MSKVVIRRCDGKYLERNTYETRWSERKFATSFQSFVARRIMDRLSISEKLPMSLEEV